MSEYETDSCCSCADGVHSLLDGESLCQDPPTTEDESTEKEEEEEKGCEHSDGTV